MGARWMQQKVAKQRKERRSHLKGYTLHMRNKKPPNKDVLAEYQERAHALGVDWRWLNTIFGCIPQENNGPRRAALARKEEIGEEDPIQFSIKLEGTRFDQLFCFFSSGDSGPAYFVYTNWRYNRIKKSKAYRNLAIAKQVYQMGPSCIEWQPSKELAPLS